MRLKQELEKYETNKKQVKFSFSKAAKEADNPLIIDKLDDSTLNFKRFHKLQNFINKY